MKPTPLDETAVIRPEWPAPANVVAFTTTRRAPDGSTIYGEGDQAFADFNLADHVGDAPEKVIHNRKLLRQALGLPNPPRWLSQCHSNLALNFDAQHDNDSPNSEAPQADAAYTSKARQVCVVLTADCLPLLLCQRQGRTVAAVHAGWRGLLDGVIENTIAGMGIAASELLAWMGPAIGAQQFEVGAEVRDAFVRKQAQAAQAFRAKGDKFLGDLYQLARQRLTNVGVDSIYGGQFCSFSDAALFYSYRRDGKTGRMASLIYIHE